MKIWSGRSLGSPALVLVALALLGCSGGKSTAPDAGSLADGPVTTSDASVAPPLDGSPLPSKDAPAKEVTLGDATSVTASDGGDAMPVKDAVVEDVPAYQHGQPFAKIQFDLLGLGWGEWVCGVLPQPSGQIILVGTANTEWVSSFSDPAANVLTLVRLNADGTRDTSFGTAGKTAVSVPGHSLNACRTAVQTKEGKILAAGDAISSLTHTGSGVSYNNDFVVARFNQDGTLDTGFGNGGMATTNFQLKADDPGEDDRVTSMAVLDDGRILVAGSMSFRDGATYTHAAFARYLPDGAPDPTFGAAGMLTLDPTTTKGALVKNIVTASASAVLADPDGGTVAGISATGSSSGYAIAILRLGPDGKLDESFGDGGVRWEAPDSKWSPLTLVQLSRNADGKLAVLATYQGGSTVLYRYSAQGLVDASFGSDGQSRRPNQTMGAGATRFMLRPADGSFLVGLSAAPLTGGYGSETHGTFSLIHFSADGLFDDAFGELNWTWSTGPSGGPVVHISAGALLASGDLVVAGDVTTNRQYNTDTTALYLKKRAGN